MMDPQELRILELEYRLGILERYLEREAGLFIQQDRSVMNAIKIEVLNDLRERGFDVEQLHNRIGKKLYIKPD